MPTKDPDDAIVPIFKDFAMRNEGRSAAAGRPVFDDVEMIELHYPGSKNWSAHPATSFSHWGVDPETGEQVKVSYAERFRKQYQQFKAHSTQTKSGTPLTYAPFLTEARRAELKAQNIYTVEALASIEGQPLKNLGPGGREMKNAAMAYIEETQKGAVNSQMAAELEALRATNAVMAEDLAMLKAKAREPISNAQAGSDEFDDMTDQQLREYITFNTGQAPRGSIGRKNLLRMSREAQPKEAAA